MRGGPEPDVEPGVLDEIDATVVPGFEPLDAGIRGAVTPPEQDDDMSLSVVSPDLEVETELVAAGAPGVDGPDHTGDAVELPPHLSPSSASAFDHCPRRWKFKYVDRLKEPSGQPALVGTFAHRVLELLCELPPSGRTQETAKALARECWPEMADDPEFAALELDDEGERAFRWQSWLAIAGLWTLEDPAEVDVVGTERKVSAQLDAVPFLGIVDRLDRRNGQLVVSDYKSGTVPRLRFRGDKIQQVLLYAAAIAENEGELPDRARLLYLGQRIIDIPVTPRRLEEATGALGTTWDAVGTACSAGTFEAKPGVLCGWCPFAEQCPEGLGELRKRKENGNLPAHAPAKVLVA